jgi:hypothetical protein
MLAVGIQGGWRQPRGGQPPHTLGGLLQGLVTYTEWTYYFVKKRLYLIHFPLHYVHLKPTGEYTFKNSVKKFG